MEIIGELTGVVKVPGVGLDGKAEGVFQGPGDVAFELKDGRGVKEMVDEWVADGLYIPAGAKKAEAKPHEPKVDGKK